LLTSCHENLYFNPPIQPERLCSIGIIDADDTAHSIFFQKSFQIGYPDEKEDSLKDLTFRISKENNVLFSFHSENTLGNNYHIKSVTEIKIPNDLIFDEGDQYSFWAKEKDTRSISSTIVIPKKGSDISIISITGGEFGGQTDPYIKPYKAAVINFSFDVDQQSYYTIILEGTGELNNKLAEYNLLYIVQKSNLPGFTTLFPGLSIKLGEEGYNTGYLAYYAYFIDGAIAAGKICDLTIAVAIDTRFSYDYTKPVRIKLLSIPKELYLFEKSLYTLSDRRVDPFSEPVYISGNIIGGNGVFAICRSTEVSLMLPWQEILGIK
jgi:hypothetical protein